MSLEVRSHSICWLCKKRRTWFRRGVHWIDEAASLRWSSCPRGTKAGARLYFLSLSCCACFSFPVLGLLCTRGRIHYAEPCHFCQVCSSYLDVLECPEYSAGKSLCLFQIVSVMLTQTTVAPITREFYLCPKAKICLEHPCFFLASCIL